MSISNQIRALLNLTGKKQIDLQEALGMGSKQSLNNKFSRDSWSAEDLIRVAQATGCKLAFIFPDGERILLSCDQASGPVPSGDPGRQGLG